ncbi:MAG: hypothetical protein DMG30_17325 [Acidobacteria bacterium]|nr:MAG: hypothetical protein DMG30_17325 [Acidobacteriota bacterium]
MSHLSVFGDRCRVVGRVAVLAGRVCGQRYLKSALGLYVLWRNQFGSTLSRSNASCAVAPFDDKTRLSLSPGFPTAAPGTTGVQFTAVGVTSISGFGGMPLGTTSQDLTHQVTWTSSAPTVATIDSSGLVTTHTSGQTTITASYQSASAMTTLFVGNFPQFVSTGVMTIARQGATATLLNSGKVLVAGGETPGGETASAEVYDPSSGTFSSVGNMTISRAGARATLLNNGKVLILGGTNSIGLVGLTSAELYDPSTGTFSATGSMAVGRNGHTATLLSNGKVLVAGGAAPAGETASAEVYDPSTGTFSVTGSMTVGRYVHTATLLKNGTVLIAGGVNPAGAASAEIYDPSTGTFSATGNPTIFRYQHTATLLNTGGVLLIGGITEHSQDTSSAELYDPASGTFSATGSMLISRAEHTAALLNDGEVLVAGGSLGYNVAELYDPTSGQFTVNGSLVNPRLQHTATRLINGTILLAGGFVFLSSQESLTASAELYQPSSLIPAGLVSIAVTPANPSIAVGTSQSMIANGTLSDGSVQRLASVTWSSSNAAIASISNDASNSGVAFGITAGTTTITATAGSVSGSATLSAQ